MVLSASVALLWMGIVLFLIYLFWNPKKARQMKKFLGPVIGIGLALIAVLLLIQFIPAK